MSETGSNLTAALAAMRDEPEEPTPGFPERLHASLRRELRWRAPVRRIGRDPRTPYAAAVGGALVGTVAVALLWRRARRRATAA